jgi:hypothetical protein
MHIEHYRTLRDTGMHLHMMCVPYTVVVVVVVRRRLLRSGLGAAVQCIVM